MKKKTVASAASLLPLAIGLAHLPAPKLSTAGLAEAATKICDSIDDLASCPETGCAEPGSPHAVTNELKHRKPKGSKPQTLTFADFGRLQKQADKQVGQNQPLTLAERKQKLKDLKVSGGQASEGDLVQIAGFMVGKVRPNTSGESVNCKLTGTASNDFHITLAADADEEEFGGIVVEMIPQDRDEQWNPKKLGKVLTNKLQVLVIGQLFYDNFHFVNSDPDNLKGGQPKRMSLFEIHPVTQFLVCRQQSCDPAKHNEWEPLDKLDIKTLP